MPKKTKMFKRSVFPDTPGIYCGMKCLLAAFILFSFSQAQFTFTDCADIQGSHFTTTEIFNKTGSNDALGQDGDISEPIQFDLAAIMDGAVTDSVARVDVYYVERRGKVKYFNSADNSITQIGDINVHADIVGGSTDYGLMGIALDPDFAQNRQLFLWYAPGTDDNGNTYGGGDWKRMRLSRFTLQPNNQIDMSSEKVLIQLLGNTNEHWHAGGPMTFDSHGDLWVTIGNNSTDHNNGGAGSHLSQTDSSTSDEWGTSNTSSMRGSIIRIHPDDSQKGYSVPADNFGEYWSAQFSDAGNYEVANEYSDNSMVLPEIYTKGHRSNFSIGVHPTKRWLAWADVNPGGGHDEFYITTTPLFAGYPYFYGNQTRTGSQMDRLGYQVDPAAPLNLSPLKGNGVELLPPAIPGTMSANDNNSFNFNVAIAGPIYAHQPNLKSEGQWPPHFDEHWFNFAWNGGFWIHDLDENAQVVSTHNARSGIMSSVSLRNPINAEFGPDGALYIMNYHGHYNQSNNPGLFKIEYTGPACVVSTGEPYVKNPRVTFYPGGNIISVKGNHLLELYNTEGKRLYRIGKRMNFEHNIGDLGKTDSFPAGVYIARVNLKDGSSVSRRIFILP